MRRLGYVCALVMITGAWGCQDAPAPAASESAGQQVAAGDRVVEAENRAGEGAGKVDACTILTEDKVRGALALGAHVPLEKHEGRGRTAHPLCSYRWPNPDFDPQAHARALMEKMTKRLGKRGGTGESLQEALATSRAEFEVSYTHGPSYDDAEQASRAFASHMQAAEQGATRQIEEGPAKGQSVTVRMEMEPVEGFADDARWNERWNQLSVRDGTQIFHVRVAVEQSSEANLELAKKVAQSLMGS